MADTLDDLYAGVTYKYRMDASTILAKDPDAIGMLGAAGWDTDVLKRHSGSGNVPEFGVLHREIPSPNASGTAANCGVSAGQGNGVKLSPSSIPSIGMLRKKGRRFVVALDTEFHYPRESSYERIVLSWQLCFQVPGEEDVLHEVVFYSLLGKRISTEQALAYVVKRFGVADAMRAEGVTSCPHNGYRHKHTRVWTVPTYDTKGALWKDRRSHKTGWKACKSFSDAIASCGDPEFSKAYRDLARRHKHPEQVRLDPRGSRAVSLAGYTNDYAPYHEGGLSIPVTLLCHFGRADLTSFGLRRYGVDVLRMTSQVQRGHVTIEGFPMDAPLNDEYWRFYPLDVQVRDTMCMAPAKARSLAALGESIGIPKLDLPAGYDKGRMDELLANEPIAFMDYAAQDALVTLMYASTLFGANRDLPVTVSSAGVAAVTGIIRVVYGLGNRGDFDRWLRGVERVRTGMRWDGKARRLKPTYAIRSLTDRCHLVQEGARQSYKGGINGCAGPSWVDARTYDLDLKSAYPTAMCCVYDVDWDADDVIEREWHDCAMTLADFDDPFLPMFAYVDDFSFPNDCKFPCLPMNIDGKLVYTRSLGQRDGIWVTGVEIWLALKMGATVHVSRAYRARVRRDDHGKPTRALFHAVASLVRDRTMVKRHLKTQPELAVFEQLLKQVVNSVYGKLAQGVLEKHSWDAFEERMVDIGCSGITSPAHCSMTTAIVRCTLLAAVAELDEMGYRSYSWTTDGFITDADEDTVNSLSLFGLADRLRAARTDLSGDPKVWEAKHEQDEFLNITTRGNCAPEVDGVCAMNGYSSPFAHDSKGARLNFLHKVLTREGKVESMVLGFTGHRALSGKEAREDFHELRQTKALRMDFDMKRRPVEATMASATVQIEDQTYETANLDTEPFDTPEEFEMWFAKARSCRCLRTADDWRLLFAKVRMHGQPRRHVRDLEWSRILTCVMGHRLGVWTIPELDKQGTTVADKIAWINGFNASKRAFKESDWKNCRRQNRQSQMLDRSEVDDLLKRMGAVI